MSSGPATRFLACRKTASQEESTLNTVAVLLSAFVISVAALMFFIWTQRKGIFDGNQKAAEVIFATGEVGTVEDPAASRSSRASLQSASPREGTPDLAELTARALADASTGPLVFFFLCCAFAWLLVASAAGLTASIKLHEPDLLAQWSWLSFGRIRTIHLNAVAYGWAPMAGLGIALF